jgi:transcriptional regulator with XRE-family HTH domain
MHTVRHGDRMKLKDLRSIRGLTQADLAEMIGVNQSTIQRAEAMRETVKLSTYRRCAEALGVTLADIFSDDLKPLERDMIALVRGAPPELRERLVGLLQALQPETGSHPESTQLLPPPSKPKIVQ